MKNILLKGCVFALLFLSFQTVMAQVIQSRVFCTQLNDGNSPYTAEIALNNYLSDIFERENSKLNGGPNGVNTDYSEVSAPIIQQYVDKYIMCVTIKRVTHG